MSVNFVFVSVFYALAFTVFSVICWTHCVKKYSNSTRTKLPPGRMGVPWIGETMEFYKAQRNNRLFDSFVQPRIAKHGMIFKTRLMGSPTVIVSGAEANRFLLSNEFKLVVSSWPSSSVQLMGRNSIMEKQGRQHQRIRGIISKSLGFSALETLVPKICKTIRSYLDEEWSCREEVSLYRSAKSLTFVIVFECLLGIQVKEGMLTAFEKVLEGVFALPVAIPGSKFCKAKVARGEIERMLVGIVRKLRYEMEETVEEQRESTLLTKLVSELIHGEISEDEVIDNIVLLVFAAHDTTSFAIAMTFRMLAQHPDCYALVLQEHDEVLGGKGGDNLKMKDIAKMKYTWQVAQESMRLFPPIFGSFRKTLCDIEYQGFTIPKGWKVLWTTYGTHYNEEYYTNPLSFDPRRFDDDESVIQPYVYLPFGGGPRVCAGYQLAKLNMLIFVHFVVTRYDWSLLDFNEPVVVDPLPFPAHGMPVRIAPKSI